MSHLTDALQLVHGAMAAYALEGHPVRRKPAQYQTRTPDADLRVHAASPSLIVVLASHAELVLELARRVRSLGLRCQPRPVTPDTEEATANWALDIWPARDTRAPSTVNLDGVVYEVPAAVADFIHRITAR